MPESEKKYYDVRIYGELKPKNPSDEIKWADEEIRWKGIISYFMGFDSESPFNIEEVEELDDESYLWDHFRYTRHRNEMTAPVKIIAVLIGSFEGESGKSFPITAKKEFAITAAKCDALPYDVDLKLIIRGLEDKPDALTGYSSEDT